MVAYNSEVKTKEKSSNLKSGRGRLNYGSFSIQMGFRKGGRN